MERIEAGGLFGAIGAQDQINEGGFLFFQLLLLFRFAQVGVHADVMLALVLAQVEDFKGAVIFAFGLERALNADQALARGVDGELAQIADDPPASELLGHSGRGSGATEKVSHQVTIVA